MKTLFAMLAALLVTGSAQAMERDTAAEIALLDLQVSIANEMRANNLINWKVGEYSEYDMSAAFGNIGTMKKIVASEVGNNIWLNTDTTGMAAAKMEALIDRATGQILELRQNGQKQEIPNDKPEVISQDTATITVPAGTFETIHIVAKTAKIKKLEIWANPRDITLDGAAQMMIDAGFLTITTKLTKFGGR